MEASQSLARLRPMHSIRPFVDRAGGRASFLLLALLLSVTPGVQADEGDVFNFFVGSNITYDDNVFRLSPDSTVEIIPGSTARSDTITMVSAGGNFKKMLGRQRIWLDLNLNQSRYDRFAFLDFDGHSNAAGWDWRLGNKLSGKLAKTSARQMAGFADLRRTVQNLYDNESELASLDYWFAANWHFETEMRRNSIEYDAKANQTGNRIEDGIKFGFRYTPRDGSYILLRALAADGRLPNQQVVADRRIDNSYKQSEIGIEFSTDISGPSIFRGVLAQTQREHENVPERDFSGITGNLGWQWAVTGKTQLNARVRREIGASNDLLASYILTNGANIGMTWQPTGKISAILNYDFSKRDYAGDPITELAGLEDRKDRINTLSLNVSYELMRNLAVTLNLVRSRRDSNVPGLPFVDNMATLGARFSF